MSLLRDLEQRLESLFEGFFAKQFKSGVQPVEIAKRLARQMDANRTISVSKLYVPNHYTILLGEADAEKLKPFEATLRSELQDFLVKHAKREGYDLLGRPHIEIRSSPELTLGELVVTSELKSPEPGREVTGTRVLPSPEPVAKAPVKQRGAYLVRSEDDGEKKIALSGRSVRIGRGADNHIVVADPNVSRHHAKVDHVGASYVLTDLGSTNGTFVNGHKVTEQTLRHGDTIVIGTTKLRFRGDAGV